MIDAKIIVGIIVVLTVLFIFGTEFKDELKKLNDE